MNFRQKKESVLLGPLLTHLAPKIGARVLLESWGYAGQITFASGKKTYFRYNTMDLNPVGASDIAKDKDYANFFMQDMGYPVIPNSKTFFSKEWSATIGVERRGIDDAYLYAKSIGFPVVVKPNSGSRGAHVAFVHTKQDFYKAMRAIFRSDRIALVQSPVQGKDYRIVVLDDSIISAYERIPLSVVGDGTSSIRVLLERKQAGFLAEKRDTQINVADPRIAQKLQRQGLHLDSVVQSEECVFLLDNANLSTGGDSRDVTDCVHKDFAALAIRLTRDMGLRLCGVDIIVSGDISEVSNEYWIIEINAAPGLDHYARSGAAQVKIVEDLYMRVLKALDN